MDTMGHARGGAVSFDATNGPVPDFSIGTFDEISSNDVPFKDRHRLARLGKKEALKRRFGFLSVFGFSCAILITWETGLALFQETFENGGSAGLAWGFPIAWLCSLSVYMCLAEMASIAPIAGGQYFWVSILAPKRWKRFLSYITGWLTSMAWVATLATGSLFLGTIIQGLIILNYPDYEGQNYQGTLLTWAVIAVAVLVNTLLAGILPFLEGLILLLHVLGFVATLITVAYLSPHIPASQVFFSTLNEGNWPTQGLSFCVGFIGNVATFVGADAAVHMSEEIEDAARNVPRAILTTMILNGSTGYAIILVLLFAINDPESVLESATGFPFIQVFYDTAGIMGANGLTIILILLVWCAVIGFLATASRMTWSFARDQGLPFHHIISQVQTRTRVPVYAVILVMVIPVLLTLIYIGSPVAYNDVISLSVSGLYLSYFIPCSLLLWRRLAGQIKPHGYMNETYYEDMALGREDTHDSSHLDDVLLDPIIEWGPWRLPAVLGTLNNAFACVYCLFVLFWDFWPPATPVDAASMNYSFAVTIIVIIFSIVYYYTYGKHQYRGPLIDKEVKGIANRYVVVRSRSRR